MVPNRPGYRIQETQPFCRSASSLQSDRAGAWLPAKKRRCKHHALEISETWVTWGSHWLGQQQERGGGGGGGGCLLSGGGEWQRPLDAPEGVDRPVLPVLGGRRQPGREGPAAVEAPREPRSEDHRRHEVGVRLPCCRAHQGCCPTPELQVQQPGAEQVHLRRHKTRQKSVITTATNHHHRYQQENEGRFLYGAETPKP